MDFIRKIKGNVQESFSILNEGIQITNGILELKTLHLPLLLQLSPLVWKRNVEGAVCCVLEENNGLETTENREQKEKGRERNKKRENKEKGKGVEESQPIVQEIVESQDITPKEKLLGKLKLVPGVRSVSLEASPVNQQVSVINRCVLNENCLLKRISPNIYNQSINFVGVFLNTLNKVLEDDNRGSRKVVENQCFCILYEISQLYDVALFLKTKTGNQKVSQIVGDVNEVHGSIVSIVAFSLKLLNEILKYPLNIYYNNLNREYDDSKIERKKYDMFLKQRFPNENIDEYDLVGSYSFININEEEKKELDQYLYYVDSILDISSNSRSVLESVRRMSEENDGMYNDVVYGFLVLFQKLFGYNDLNWHLSQNDSDMLYFWNRYYDSSSYYIYYQDYCYECRKPKMNTELSCSGDYCVCFLSNQKCNFRVKLVLEDLLMNDAEFVEFLFKILKKVKEVYIKSRIFGLFMQIMTQVDCFIELFHSYGGIDVVYEILDNCSQDQFYLLDTTLNAVVYKEYKPLTFLSLINDNDMNILMTFPPCTIEAIMLIHNYLLNSKYQTSWKNSSVLTSYARKLMLVYTYYKCTYQSSKSLQVSNLFSQILYIILEATMVSQVCVRDIENRNEVFFLNLVEKLDVLEEYNKMRVDVVNKNKDNDNAKFSTTVNNGVSNSSSTSTGTGTTTKNKEKERGDERGEELETTEKRELREGVGKVDLLVLNERYDFELFNLVACSFVVLINLAKLGTFVEYQVIQGITNYLGYGLSLLNFLSDRGVDVLSRVSYLYVNQLPQVYKYMLNVIYSKETMDVEYLEDVVRLKVNSLMNFNNLPIFQLAISLMDPYINTRVTSKFTRDVFDLCSKLQLFSPEWETGRDIDSYFCSRCYEFSQFLDQDFEDGRFVFYRKFVLNYTSILLFPYLLNESRYTEVRFLKNYNLNFILESMSKIVKILKKQSGPNLESIMVYLLRFLLHTTFSADHNSRLYVLDFTSIFEFIKLNLDSEKYGISKGIGSVVLLYLISVGTIVDENVEMIGELSRCVDQLYLSNEFKAAQVALKVDDIQPVDSLGMEFEFVVKDLLTKLSNTSKTNLVELFFWNKNNFYNFTMSPHIFKELIMFKLYVHPHLFGKLSRFLNRSVQQVLPSAKSDMDVNQLATSQMVDESVLDAPLVLLKRLYDGELEYARNNISGLQSQMEVLANSLRLSQIANKNLRNKMSLLEKQVEGPSGEEDFNLELELEIERQRYAQLEKTYNILLSQYNALTFSNTQ